MTKEGKRLTCLEEQFYRFFQYFPNFCNRTTIVSESQRSWLRKKRQSCIRRSATANKFSLLTHHCASIHLYVGRVENGLENDLSL